jgi:hypothetical protein
LPELSSTGFHLNPVHSSDIISLPVNGSWRIVRCRLLLQHGER